MHTRPTAAIFLMIAATVARPEPLALAHLWEDDAMLFARYVRR